MGPWADPQGYRGLIYRTTGLVSMFIYYPPEVRRTKYYGVRVFRKNTSLSAGMGSRSD